MKQIVFTCNLCNHKKEPKDLLGIHWTGSYGSEIPKLKQNPHDHNTHICLSCLQNLAKGLDNN